MSQINNMSEITVEELTKTMRVLEALLTKTKPESSAPQRFAVGEKVFIRTVTHYYTGKVVAFDDVFVWLDTAAWIADTGRFSDALTSSCELAEVEPIPGIVRVAIGSMVDVIEWRGVLPVNQK